jgi:hypothetical protein
MSRITQNGGISDLIFRESEQTCEGSGKYFARANELVKCQ